MSTDDLHKYPGTLKQHKVEPFLSDSLYEKLCEARRYPGQMITHAWDARLQQRITAAMEQEAELQRLRGLLEEGERLLSDMCFWHDGSRTPKAKRRRVEVKQEARTFLSKLKK